MSGKLPYSHAFLTFWNAYPRKVGKGAAWRAWQQSKAILPPMEALLTAVQAQAASEQWQKDGGQYIPHPATWLRQRRWEDEAPPPAAPKAQQAGGTPEMIERLAALEKAALIELDAADKQEGR